MTNDELRIVGKADVELLNFELSAAPFAIRNS